MSNTNLPPCKIFYGKYRYAFSKMIHLSKQGYIVVGYKAYPDNTFRFMMRRSDLKTSKRKVK